jgi:hypothetical protein
MLDLERVIDTTASDSWLGCCMLVMVDCGRVDHQVGSVIKDVDDSHDSGKRGRSLSRSKFMSPGSCDSTEPLLGTCVLESQ